MAGLNLNCLLGEAGDVLLDNYTYFMHFDNLRSEEDHKHYRRLINIPLAIDTLLIEESLLIITTEGELMFFDNFHPLGVTLNLNTPPLQNMYHSKPFSVLDVENTLHFIDIIQILNEAVPEFDASEFHTRRSENDIPMRVIKDVQWLIPYRSVGFVVDYIIIKVLGGLIIDTPSRISSGEYQLKDRDEIIEINEESRYGSEVSEFVKLGNCYSYYLDGIRFIGSVHGREIKISDDVIDVVHANNSYYILDSKDYLIKLGKGGKIKKPNFDPIRLLKSTNNQNVFVEDAGGNIYDVGNVLYLNDPPSLDLPVILNGFQQRGRTTKRARYN